MNELVGRDGELGMLLGLLDDARARRGRAVLVLGDAGIGKTHLTETFAAAAGKAALTVGWGHCTEAEAPPYWPWRQAFRALPGSNGRLLRAEIPEVRDALFAAVADELEEATGNGPAVIVIEDIHWADASSLALLRFVIGVLPDLPLVLVLTARDDPGELTDEAATALRDLPPAVHRLPLGGLDSEATGLIVRSLCGRDVPDSFVTEVHDRTGGNPFFVREVATLRTLQGDRSSLAVPVGVRQVLGRRLARLSQPAHEVLAVGAVAGDELDPELLAIMTDRSLDEVLGVLEEARMAHLVVRREDAIAFAHSLVRETLYEDQSPTARAALHATAAEALEAWAARRGGEDGLDARLAAHWRRATGEEARRRAGGHALAAARAATRRMGYEQAAQYYRWALDAGADDHLALLLELGEAQILAGDLTAGRATLAEAAAAAIEARRADELARSVLAMGGGVGGFEVEVGNADQIRLLEAALALLPDGDGSLRTGVLGRLSVTITGAGAVPRRIELARDAAGMARRIDDPEAEVAALAAYCDAVSGPDHVDERLAATARMLDLTVDPRLVLLARRIRLVALLERGDFAPADAEAAAYAVVADHLRLPLYQWPVPIWRGMRALMRGEFDAAWRHSAEAEELGRRAGSANAEIMVYTLRVAAAVSTGTTGVLAERFRWASDMLPDYPPGPIFVAASAIDADPELSRAMFERARASGLDALPRDAEWLEAVWLFGEAGMRYGDPDMVRAAYDALVPYADLWAIDGIGAACFGVTSHQLGRLSAFLGRTKDAERWLRQGLERHRAAGANYLLFLSEWALAGLGAPDATRAAPPVREGQLRRDGRVWHVGWQGETATVPDSKGMRDLAALLTVPGREVHVLDLVDGAGGPAARGVEGDAGPALDRRAREAYRQRLEDLEEDVAEAEQRQDAGRAAGLRAERDFLAAELGAALGLGGRDRLAGDRVERARKAVAMRIATALRAIAEAHPALAHHLRVSVTTGRFCAYRPEGPVRWRM